MLKRVARLSFVPSSIDAGLLILRVLIGLNLFLKHGYEKLFHFSNVVARVPDVLHIGVPLTIFLAAISDSFGSFLIMAGFATRLACAYSFAVISIAWVAREHFMYFGHDADHGELMALYLSALLAILVTGPGRYSIDARITGSC